MRRIALLLSTLLLAQPAIAHDFWLQPRNWRPAVGEIVPISMLVGHGQYRELWQGEPSRLVVLRDFWAGGTVNLRGRFRSGGASPQLNSAFRAPGLHIVAMTSTNTPSELPAIRFNDYLVQEGLTPAIAVRKRARTASTPGRERFSRRAKALLMVGAPSAGDAALATKPLGMSLEIVPLRNPYGLGRDRRLPVTVLFEGKPLAGALVKLTNLAADEKPVATALTNGRGGATFRIPATGSWLLNVIWTKPVASPTEEFETTFSSLTFGYPAPGRR